MNQSYVLAKQWNIFPIREIDPLAAAAAAGAGAARGPPARAGPDARPPASLSLVVLS